ncbi:MAG: cell division protein ZapA [Candidatus Eisenbacteria bacterium]|uniref:Cell division protein ZapA n=1 Tax=Eiseniibacteriota bacterium TaxID=2212470 RepID=A0A7Y2H327_UNCEI|nr:cell division protein ZapA [Candidatus Eisenbacteria bacterium]
MSQSLSETTVKIRGQNYTLRTDLSEGQMQELAEYVDDTMKALDPKAAVHPAKLSVLAALSIASDLFESRKQTPKLGEDVETRLKALSFSLDEALDGN